MKLKTLKAKLYGPIKEAVLDLDYQGLTVIFGLNKDSSQGGVTNAAGKSLLVSSLAELAYDHHPADKTKAKSKEKSVLSLVFEDGEGKTIEYQKHYHPKKEFVVLKDGKNVKHRGLDYGHEKLRKLLGSEEEFFSRIYIDGTNPHPMIAGKSAQQQDFFVKLCHLQDVDATRMLLLKQLREVQKAAASYKEVKLTFDELKSTTISEEELELLKAEKVKLEAEHEKLMERFKRDQAVRDLITFEKDNRSLIKSVLEVCHVDDFELKYQDCRARRASLKVKRQNAVVWQGYEAQLKAVKAERKPKLKEIEELVGLADFEMIESKAKLYQGAYDALRTLEVQESDLKGQLVELDEVAKPEHALEDCAGKINTLREQLEHSREFKNGKCPTCGSTVEAHDPEKVRRQLATWKSRLDDAKAYSVYRQAKVANAKVSKRLDDLEAELIVARDKAKKYRKWDKAAKLLNSLPSLPEKPEGEQPKLSVEALDEKIDSLTETIQVLKSAEPVIDKIRQVLKLDPEKKAKVKDSSNIGERLGEVNVKIADTTSRITLQTANRSQLSGLKTRGMVLKRQADDEPIIKAFIKAYSKTGYKKLRIQQYAEVFQTQVNKFASVFFSEQTEFELKYENKLTFTAFRLKGKKRKPIPVQRLSGAEKSSLTLALVAASISLQPKKHRLNVLILDEPDAHMGEAIREQFFKHVKLLNKVIPHIILVTPKNVEIEGARYFTMVKKNDVSKLVAGKV